jgi:hypothetical protein
MTGTLGRRVIFDLAASAGRRTPSDPVAFALHPDDLDSFSGKARIAYSISNRVFPFIGAELYRQNFSELTLARMDRTRYSAGFSILLTPIREAETAPAGDVSGKWPIGSPGLLPRTNVGAR